MASGWDPLHYDDWSGTCDTLHAHTQVLGKLAVVLAPPEPQLQHAALRITARGWETLPLVAPNGSGFFSVALDLRSHQAVIEHSNGSTKHIALAPDRPVGTVTRELLASISDLAGKVEINPTPQEVTWTVPLDEDDEHRTYDPAQASRFFAAAGRAAHVLAEFRAPFRGRSTPINAWWGSFDLAVNLFSGSPTEPPASDYITRNAMDSQEVAVGWWPGDANFTQAAFFAYAHPAPDHYSEATLSPAAARWEPALGTFVLSWDDAIKEPDPHAAALEFVNSAFLHSCRVCEWDPKLPASTTGDPPPII